MSKIYNIISSIIPDINRFERIYKIAQVDFKKRYYNDRLGMFWALLNPGFRVTIYWAVFTLILPRVSDGIPNYALFVFSGIIFWMVFVETSKKGMKILDSKRYLIENIKFNKLDLYLTNSISTFYGLLFNVSIYIIFALIIGIKFGLNLVALPVLILNLFFIASGFGMILSIVYIFFKDVIHLLDIVFLVGFWTSGIFFLSTAVLDKLTILYYVNPFLGILENARNILLFNKPLNLEIMSINFTFGILIFIMGVHFVNKYSHKSFEKI